MGLDTLERRRWQQDMKQTFKIIRGSDRLAKEKFFVSRQETVHTRTAEDPLHLRKEKSRLDISANIFSQRVVNSWNNISYHKNSKSLSVFTHALNRQHETGGRPGASNQET